METQKNFFHLLGEWWDGRQARRRETAQPRPPRRSTAWLPSRGNVIFTLLMIALLVAAQTVGALPMGRPQAAPSASSTSTIAYQGRLADSAGAPLTGTYNMIFRLYDAAAGGTPLWSEPWDGPNSVRVSDGLFNVMLGSLTPIPQAVVTGHDQLFLGITVGTDDEMTPRVQLGSVPFAVQALTVPDGSVTTARIADGAVTQAKLGGDVSLVPPDGSVTTAKIADGAVTPAKLDLSSNVTFNGANGDFALQVENQGSYFAVPSQTDAWGISYDGTNFGIFDRQGGGNFRIGQYYGSTSRFDFFIQGSDGHIGIGTTAPEEKLTVKGYMKTIYPAANESGGLIMTAGNGTMGQIYVVDDAWPCSNGGGVTIASDDGVNLCFRRK